MNKNNNKKIITLTLNKALEIKIPFVAVFRNLSVVFPVTLNKY